MSMESPVPASRSYNMSRVRAKNTTPERMVRSMMHRAGYRFRIHRKDLPGCPDIVFPRYRAAVFVHGCFWHGHACPAFQVPKTRVSFWVSKIHRNQDRNEDAVGRLKAHGWRTLVIWECALRGKGRVANEVLFGALRGFLEDTTAKFRTVSGYPLNPESKDRSAFIAAKRRKKPA